MKKGRSTKRLVIMFVSVGICAVLIALISILSQFLGGGLGAVSPTTTAQIPVSGVEETRTPTSSLMLTPLPQSPTNTPTNSTIPKRSTGVVLWFNNERGYGFIAPDGGGGDILVHFSEIRGETKILSEGDRVEYAIQNGPKASQALDVVVLGHAPNPTQTLQAVIDEAEKQFQNSDIGYNKPERMDKGDTADVELLLNPSLSKDALATKITERGGFVTSTAEPGILIGPSGEEVTIQTANIEITDKMRARLFSKDPNAFEIREQSELEQVIRPDNTTIWRWSITANVEGPQTIELVLYRLIQDGDKEYWTEVESYRDNIVVEVSPKDRIKSWDWKWIVGIIVTALLIPAFWRWVDSRKKNLADNKKQPGPRKRKK